MSTSVSLTTGDARKIALTPLEVSVANAVNRATKWFLERPTAKVITFLLLAFSMKITQILIISPNLY